MKKKLISHIVFDALLLAAAAVFAHIDKADLVIYFGVVIADIITAAVWIGIALLFLINNIQMILRLICSNRKQPLPIELTITYDKAIAPEDIRKEIARYRRERPALQDCFDHATAQMDSIDRKQAKIKQLFDKNAIGTLNDVIHVVDDAEQAICRNMIKILNRAILWDPMEWNQRGKERIYAQHRAYILQYLERNNQILEKCDILLSETVDYVNEKDSANDNGQLHLDVMTETIQTLKSINNTDNAVEAEQV